MSINNSTMNSRDQALTIGELALKQHPDKIPVVIYYANTNSGYICQKLLVDNTYLIKNLASVTRKKIKSNYDEMLLFSVNNQILDSCMLISTLYCKYKNPTDGCLHLKILKIKSLQK